MRTRLFFSVLMLASLACSGLATPTGIPRLSETPVPASPTPVPPPTAVPAHSAALVDEYDPARDPAADLAQAMSIAQLENKRILLELGGNWCIWCKYMDEFYATHPDLLEYRDANYVLVKVNVSEENYNETFLSQYPEVPGYPHIFILETDGTLLHSQDTAELEDGNVSYVPDVVRAFLEKWALPSQ